MIYFSEFRGFFFGCLLHQNALSKCLVKELWPKFSIIRNYSCSFGLLCLLFTLSGLCGMNFIFLFFCVHFKFSDPKSSKELTFIQSSRLFTKHLIWVYLETFRLLRCKNLWFHVQQTINLLILILNLLIFHCLHKLFKFYTLKVDTTLK